MLGLLVENHGASDKQDSPSERNWADSSPVGLLSKVTKTTLNTLDLI